MNQSQAREICMWIREQVDKAGAVGTVFGLSGGIDSAVVGALCKEATAGKSLGLIMPCHSRDEDISHAKLAAQMLGLQTLTFDIGPIFDQLKAILPAGNRLSDANLKPRLRMIMLYYFANLNGYLVVGTGNKSEINLGYFTKYGDGGVDLLPLGDLLKGEVKELARALGVPQIIIDKPPSAGLWPGQTDEAEIGITYSEIDAYLKWLENRKGEQPLTLEIERKISKMIASSAHKRDPLPVYKQKPA